MNTEEYERRRRIWEVFTYEDLTYSEVIETVMDEFEVSEETVKNEIENIDRWLHWLDVFRDVQGISLLAELRDNRRRLHQMADMLHDQEEFTEERKIGAEINRSINIERYMKDSSLGVTKKTSKFDEIF